MTHTKDEALKLALDALGLYQAAGFGNSTDFNKQHEAFYKAQTAITAIKQALAAQPAPLPARVTEEMHVAAVKVLHRANGVDGLPQRMLDAMLAVQPAQPAEPLTDEQIESLLPDDDTPMSLGEAFVKFARLVEAAHGITEKGGAA